MDPLFHYLICLIISLLDALECVCALTHIRHRSGGSSSIRGPALTFCRNTAIVVNPRKLRTTIDFNSPPI